MEQFEVEPVGLLVAGIVIGLLIVYIMRSFQQPVVLYLAEGGHGKQSTG